jgi:hypothetical protein
VLPHKVSDDLDHDIFGQAVQVKLHRMFGPVATPVVVQADLQCLILLVNTISEEILYARIFGIGNVRTNVEEEAAVIAKRRGMAAMIVVLVVHHGSDALGVQPVSCAEPSHSAS